MLNKVQPDEKSVSFMVHGDNNLKKFYKPKIIILRKKPLKGFSK